ncbi:Cellulose synthase-like protein E1, partial [Mucuna pruriens]
MEISVLGLIAPTLPQTLVQHKRWFEGDLQILLSKYSYAWFDRFWKDKYGAPNGMFCLATLYYSIIPSLYLLRGIPLFPKVTKQSPFISA